MGLRQQGDTLVITNTNSSKYPDKSFSVNTKQAGDWCLSSAGAVPVRAGHC